jgi:Chlorophyll A-B binding protein
MIESSLTPELLLKTHLPSFPKPKIPIHCLLVRGQTMAKSKNTTPNNATPKGFGKPISEKRSKIADEGQKTKNIFGFTPHAELWNGRLAMIGFIAVLAIEFLTHQGILEVLGLQ